MLKARRALVSVSDKRGLGSFVSGLVELGVEILSTGGTFRALEELGVPATRVAEITDFPEILDGRVKTLHPKIHGGILADRSRARHLTELSGHGIAPIDLVIVNLYPFRESVSDPTASFADKVEMIDIGGPSMVRGAAKNHLGVVVVVDPNDYPQVLAALEEGEGTVSEKLRRRLAIKAFRHTQSYDAAIARWLETRDATEEQAFPHHIFLDLERRLLPRYGENPHQEAAVYEVSGGPGILDGFTQLQGKELSWNNLLDAQAARQLVSAFEEPAVVIVKHNNPCGVGLGETARQAFERARGTDPTSAFGSIVATNRSLDDELAEAVASLFVEVLLAPAVDPVARERLAEKKALRILEVPTDRPEPGELDFRSIDGGFLVQTVDNRRDDPELWTCPTERRPAPEERRALELGWTVCRGVKSNAIVVANPHQTVGIGAGQMSRVDSCELAISKAVLPVEGAVAASDAFFPFRDGLDRLAAAGVTAVVQPGGSKRDDEVIAAANEYEMAMLFTGVRHFKH